MRKILDFTYRASGYIAAIFLFLIFAVVIIQVSLNVINSIYTSMSGNSLGLMLPSYSDFAGYFLGASTFFAIAYAMQKNELVRVSIILNLANPRAQRWMEIICCIVGLALSLLMTYYFSTLIIESYLYNDQSYGMVRIPLWIPQLPFVIGSGILCIALIDNLVSLAVSGKTFYNQVKS